MTQSSVKKRVIFGTRQWPNFDPETTLLHYNQDLELMITYDASKSEFSYFSVEYGQQLKREFSIQNVQLFSKNSKNENEKSKDTFDPLNDSIDPLTSKNLKMFLNYHHEHEVIFYSE